MCYNEIKDRMSIKKGEKMADLVYNENKLSETTDNLDNNIRKLREELETFNTNYEVVRANWSGSEFNKANEKLLEIKKTLETAIADNEQQLVYLKQKNADFAEVNSGL